jgi:hypothetical protein
MSFLFFATHRKVTPQDCRVNTWKQTSTYLKPLDWATVPSVRPLNILTGVAKARGMRRATAIRDNIVVVGIWRQSPSANSRKGHKCDDSRHVTFLLHHPCRLSSGKPRTSYVPRRPYRPDKIDLLPDLQARQASSKRAFASSAVSRKGTSFIVDKPYLRLFRIHPQTSSRTFTFVK